MKSQDKAEKHEKKPFGIQGFITIIILVHVCLFGSFSDSMIVNKTDAKPDHSISLLPVGAVDEGVMEVLKSRLSETFRCDVRIRGNTNIPPETYNPQRKQYWSSRILDVLHKLVVPSEREKYLAITGVDLYVNSILSSVRPNSEGTSPSFP